MEIAGLIAPKLERESEIKPLTAHLEEFIADLKVRGHAERYCTGVDGCIRRLLTECKWKAPMDIQADTFIIWKI